MRHPPAAPSALQVLINALSLDALRTALIAVLNGAADHARQVAGDDELDTSHVPHPGAAAAPPGPAQDATKKRGGWPRGVPRSTRTPAEAAATLAARRAKYAATARAKRAAARHAKVGKTGKPNGGNGASAEPTLAERLWQHAEKLEPARPYRAVTQKLGVHSAQAVDHFRRRTVPPGPQPTAALPHCPPPIARSRKPKCYPSCSPPSAKKPTLCGWRRLKTYLSSIARTARSRAASKRCPPHRVSRRGRTPAGRPRRCARSPAARPACAGARLAP
jgi:hypothetical protein